MANILIVEDEKNMQSIIVEYMHRGGHTCFTADDGVDCCGTTPDFIREMKKLLG